MRKTLLLKLADLLQEDAKNPTGIKFDLSHWGEGDGANPVSCGTVGCAMGLAVASNTFTANGLRGYRAGDSLKPRWASDPYGMHGFDAIQKLFSISNRAAFWLFSNHIWNGRDYINAYRGSTIGAEGEMKVARRIRAYVAGRSKPPTPKRKKG